METNSSRFGIKEFVVMESGTKDAKDYWLSLSNFKTHKKGAKLKLQPKPYTFYLISYRYFTTSRHKQIAFARLRKRSYLKLGTRIH